MGVPALFRWLSKKYPRIVEHVEEETPKTVPGEDGQEEELPIDISGPNPNGMEFDCLYLDYNGIVHNCTHPEGRPAPETEEDMMAAIFEYTEQVISMVRPRKLLMIAIDGVAPRAKMNQQRSRRFRAAQEAKEKEEEKEKAQEEWKARGLPVTDEALDQKKPFDSNVITPGTPFQELLTNSLKYWIAKKLNQDPGWKDLQVILSDASSPGEGEHKIMDHIRRQRSQVDYDPNTTHIMYGLDADLIMLSLATHEPHFKVLREDVFAQDPVGRKCHRCGREGHIAANCIGEAKEKSGEHDEIGEKKPEKKAFIFLDVAVLREYLSIELDVPGLRFPFNLERAIDDWVFLIFLTGNDFLPHAPSLEIREGAIDSLLKIWKGALSKMGGYLTNHGKVEMKNVQFIFDGLASQEDDIFRRRKETEERQDANAKRRKIEDEDRQRRDMALENFQHGEQQYVETRAAIPDRRQVESVKVDSSAVRKSNLEAAEKLKAEMLGLPAKPVKSTVIKSETIIKNDGEDLIKVEEKIETVDQTASISMENGSSLDSDIKSDSLAETFQYAPSSSQRGTKRGIDDVDTDEADNSEIIKANEDDLGNESVDPVVETFKQRKVNADGTVDVEDTVKLWEPGYRERYYRQKFGIELSDTEFRRNIVKSYMEGLCWVLEYYYHGCPSWTWYYPYHFAPFAADFTELESLEISFVEGKPFRPYDQLMGVLPAGSRDSIPIAFHPLMTDPDSEIIDFYPETFVIDPNGKKMAWQGVALLPFIDEKRLLTAINSRYHELSEDEVRRNGFGDHFLLVAEENQVYDDLCGLYAKRGGDKEMRISLNPKHTRGIFGFVRPDPLCIPGSTYYSPLTSIGLNDLINDRSISALYEFPTQRKPHKSILLGGVKLPRSVLTEEERETTRRGGRGGGRGGRGGGRGGYNHHSHNTDYRSAANGHGHAGGSGLRMGSGPLAGGGGSGRGASLQNGNDQRSGHAQYRNEMNGGGYSAYGGALPASNFDPYYQNNQRGASGNMAYAPPQHIRYGDASTYSQGGQYPQQQQQQQHHHQSYGSYGGYGGAYGGGAYAPPAAPVAAPYGGYGNGGYGSQQNSYGNYAPVRAAPIPVPAPYGGYGGYGSGQPPNPYRQAGPPASGPPRPLGFRSGADANSNNHRGGQSRY